MSMKHGKTAGAALLLMLALLAVVYGWMVVDAILFLQNGS